MYIEQFRLDGKVAIITGGSRGLGKEIARAFAEQGARLALCSRKQAGVDAAAEEIRQLGAECMAAACHTGQPDQIRDFVQKVIDAYGTVDILVNNAATNPYFGPMLHAEEAAWDKTVDVNLKGYFLMIQAAARVMAEKEQGTIINLSSIAGFSPTPMQGIYSITKAGVISMTAGFARELAPYKIRVNAICPGLAETNFSKILINTPEIYDIAMQRIPMQRPAQPSEVVCAALYLASEASSYVTGSTITIDGGAMA